MSGTGKTDNLRPVQSKDEARERGRKGGIKSGETRRRQKSFKTMLTEIAKLQVPEGKLKAVLEDAGIDPTHGEAVAYSMVNGAIRGNPRMMDLYLKYSGQDKLRELEIKEKAGNKGQGGGGDMAKLIDALTAGAAIDWEPPGTDE